LLNATGKLVASASLPALEAPIDLKPRTAAVRLEIPGKISLAHAQIVLSLSGNPAEITLRNNRLMLP
jgi:hypothetical protein